VTEPLGHRLGEEAVRHRCSRGLTLRLTMLYGGLSLYGFSMGLILLSGLGNMPWDVLHEGLARQTALGVGTWVIIVGALVLVLWVPLRIRPGLGTISNVVVIGVVLDLTLAALRAPEGLPAETALLVAGILLNALATGIYIGASFGPGPRDGLMTGLAARGVPLRAARTGIEAAVVIIGALLGGTVGLGTLLYAVTIGPLVHHTVPLFAGPDQPEAH
jgi:uncharacterized membrane protein YczE